VPNITAGDYIFSKDGKRLLARFSVDIGDSECDTISITIKTYAGLKRNRTQSLRLEVDHTKQGFDGAKVWRVIEGERHMVVPSQWFVLP
jgi:hypothetical protein